VHAVAFWFQLDMDGAGNVLDTSPANTRCLASACLPTRVPANSPATLPRARYSPAAFPPCKTLYARHGRIVLVGE
jgi:hypothetical protein